MIKELYDLQEVVNTWFHETASSLQLMHRDVCNTLHDIKQELSTMKNDKLMEMNSSNDISEPLQNELHECKMGERSANTVHGTSIKLPTTSHEQESFSETNQTPRNRFIMSEGGSNTKESYIFSPSTCDFRNHEIESYCYNSSSQIASAIKEDGGDHRTDNPNKRVDSNVNKRKFITKTDEYVVLVEFKRERVKKFKSKFAVLPGEYVVVSADRGEDIGRVKDCINEAEEVAKNVNSLANTSLDQINDNKCGEVLRLATRVEVSQLQGILNELEDRALEVAAEKVLEHNLPMRIIYTEYQYDRRKITIFYESDHKIDFRNLLTDLFKTFHARI